MTFINFTDKIMASIYKLIFGTTLPRITKEMKAYLQNSNEPVGNWFLYKEYTMLRICVFEEEHYRLPVFLTKSTFSLEFLRQRLHVESDLFLKHKKASNMKFKYTIDPFVVISTSALSIVQSFLKTMVFNLIRRLNMILSMWYLKERKAAKLVIISIKRWRIGSKC